MVVRMHFITLVQTEEVILFMPIVISPLKGKENQFRELSADTYSVCHDSVTDKLYKLQEEIDLIFQHNSFYILINQK